VKIDSYFSGFFLVSASTLVSVIGLLVVRRVLRSKNLISSHDVGGYLLSVVGTTYAVILGLIVVDAMSRFQEARQTTEREANALADVVLLSNQLPAKQRTRVQELAQVYIARVLDDEWAVLDHGRFEPSARRAAIDLIDAVTAFEPQTGKEQEIYGTELEAVCEFWNCRRSRINTAAHGVPTLEWVILLVGAVITIAFTYFFKLEHLRIQIVMTAMVAMIIALCLFLVLMFGYPYSGELKIDPSCFKVTQSIIAYQGGRVINPGPTTARPLTSEPGYGSRREPVAPPRHAMPLETGRW
jgi:hypothetical protein